MAGGSVIAQSTPQQSLGHTAVSNVSTSTAQSTPPNLARRETTKDLEPPTLTPHVASHLQLLQSPRQSIGQAFSVLQEAVLAVPSSISQAAPPNAAAVSIWYVRVLIPCCPQLRVQSPHAAHDPAQSTGQFTASRSSSSHSAVSVSPSLRSQSVPPNCAATDSVHVRVFVPESHVFEQSPYDDHSATQSIGQGSHTSPPQSMSSSSEFRVPSEHVGSHAAHEPPQSLKSSSPLVRPSSQLSFTMQLLKAAAEVVNAASVMGNVIPTSMPLLDASARPRMRLGAVVAITGLMMMWALNHGSPVLSAMALRISITTRPVRSSLEMPERTAVKVTTPSTSPYVEVSTSE
mmetsp:Transcript_24550/g.36000  ORF Transcript_24550/g.36000 Transcript_24550/m.36000 type:complete len:346 (-) Transcript_24550:3283-4320(-)